MEEILNSTEEKMMLTIESLENKFTNVRAGRANPNMLDGIMVEYYGVPTPLKSLANISIPEARQLSIKPFDRSCLGAIEKAIFEANLGVTPNNNGEVVFIVIPPLTEDRRKELVKQAKKLVEDNKIRKYIKKKLYVSGISKIEIERTAKFVKVNVYTAKPGLVIGKGGNLAETLKNELQKMINKDVNLNIVEVKNADMDAQLVAENIAGQLERRISFRRAMKQCMQKTMKSGALGIKTSVSGRLGGADMARTEFYKDGTIPLQTLRADIDYGFAEADTTYGKIGVKVWIYKGEVLPTKKEKVEGGED